MRRVSSTVAAASRLGTLQQRAIEALRAEKVAEVAELVQSTPGMSPPDYASYAPYPHSGRVFTQQGGTWVVDAALAATFERARQQGYRSLDVPVKKSFSDRFRDVASERPRAVSESVAVMCQIVASMTQAIADADSESRRAAEARHAQARTLRAKAEDGLTATLRRHAEGQAILPAPLLPWANEAWDDWTPRPGPADVYAGRLRPQRDQDLGDNSDFGCDVAMPFYLRPLAGVHLVTHQATRQAAQALVRSMLVRTLAAHAPGGVRMTVFDPVGLGQSVAPLLRLGEFDPALIGGKVWSSSSDLRTKLAELTSHIELVVQTYLRADHATLADYNAAAGDMATAHRLLVVFDFPAQFDSDAFGDLRRIIETGPRCGVGTILVRSAETPFPPGVDVSSLSASLTQVTLAAPFASPLTNGYELQCNFEADSDQEIPELQLDRIVHAVGSGARSSTGRSVSFAKVFGLFCDEGLRGVRTDRPRLDAPVDPTDSATWWSLSSLTGISAPIGQRGARDAAALSFDSANQSGALLVGRPGSGKSTLLHTYLAGLTALYSPEELELHLIDFKEGVEFKVYAADALPHARSVAIESDREFGVSVLQTLQAEIARRASLLRGTVEAHSSLETLRRATGEPLPRILLVFDEFQVLFARVDRLGTTAAELLESVIRQGRGFGVHVLLASQSLAGMDALGSHVPQLLPVRVLLPAAETDAYQVLGEMNTEAATLTAAGEGILNTAGGAVEANERFQGGLLDEADRRDHVRAARVKADAEGFTRKPIVFEGSAPICAEDTPPPRFFDELRGAAPRRLRFRFAFPMAMSGSADIELRRESGANVLLVARDTSTDAAGATFSLPRALTANVVLSAISSGAVAEIVDFLPVEDGLQSFADHRDRTLVRTHRRRDVAQLIGDLASEVQRRVDADETGDRPLLLVLYGMHRARDFDQESVDYDPESDLGETLRTIMRDGPEVGIHVFAWFDTVAGVARRLPPTALREMSWRLAGRMSVDDSESLLGTDAAGSLREQQVIAANDDHGLMQRCTAISQPSSKWIADLLQHVLTSG